MKIIPSENTINQNNFGDEKNLIAPGAENEGQDQEHGQLESVGFGDTRTIRGGDSTTL